MYSLSTVAQFLFTNHGHLFFKALAAEPLLRPSSASCGSHDASLPRLRWVATGTAMQERCDEPNFMVAP